MTTPISNWLRDHTPVEPSLLEGAGFEMLVAERLAAFGGSEQAYVAQLERSPEEVDRLIAGIAVPETWLFRYPRAFDLLLEFLRHRLESGAAAVRMISIGCATGQEPYCLAMTALHAGWPVERVSIEAFDRNRDFLRVAQAGVYPISTIRSETPAWAVPFLHRRGDRICIDPSVRAFVRFTKADITDPVVLRGTGPCDVIFCRNVLIYLNAAARERLIHSICEELAPGGLIFVGHAEQLLRGAAPLRVVNAPHAFALEQCTDAVSERKVQNPVVHAGGYSLAPSPPHPRAVSQTPVFAPAPGSPPMAPPEASIEDARELADAGRTEEGEQMVHAIVARRGPTAPAMELLGLLRMSVNDPVGAKRLFEQAVYLEPTRSASLLQLALLSEQSGDARRAAMYWERARRAASPGEMEQRS